MNGISADYMHRVLLGVTWMLMKLWFTSTYHSELRYMGNIVKVVDSWLCKLLPPNEIQRTPRSIEKTVKFWKGKYSLAHDHFNNFNNNFLCFNDDST